MYGRRPPEVSMSYYTNYLSSPQLGTRLRYSGKLTNLRCLLGTTFSFVMAEFQKQLPEMHPSAECGWQVSTFPSTADSATPPS